MKSFLIATLCLLASQYSWGLKFDRDVPAKAKDAFLADLDLTYKMEKKSQTPLHKEIFGGLKGSDYQKYFESRITSVGMDDCGGGPSVAACVQPMLNPHKMWLTPNIVQASIPQIARIIALYHEARHSESQHGFWSHDTCPTPFLDENGKDIVGIISGAKLEGQDACDSTVYGSYGSSTIMVKNIAKFCTNCSEKIMMDADVWATDQAKRMDTPQAKAALKKDFAFN